MSAEYFKCDLSVCGSAPCCHDRYSDPLLTPGDWLRLSEKIGEPVDEIWKKYGDVSIETSEVLGDGVFLVGLGLDHYPCPFLSREKECTVYDSRPLSCVAFPAIMLCSCDYSPHDSTNYPCLSGDVTASPDQREAMKVLHWALYREQYAEHHFFWREKQPMFSLGKPEDVQDFLKTSIGAIDNIKTKKVSEERTERAVQAGLRLKECRTAGGDLRLNNREVKEIAKPFMFLHMQEQIGHMLSGHGQEYGHLYTETTGRMQEPRKIL